MIFKPKKRYMWGTAAFVFIWAFVVTILLIFGKEQEMDKYEYIFWWILAALCYVLLVFFFLQRRCFLEIRNDYVYHNALKKWKSELGRIKRWACFYRGGEQEHIVLEDTQNRQYFVHQSILYKKQFRKIYQELEAKFGPPVKNELILKHHLYKDVTFDKEDTRDRKALLIRLFVYIGLNLFLTLILLYLFHKWF